MSGRQTTASARRGGARLVGHGVLGGVLGGVLCGTLLAGCGALGEALPLDDAQRQALTRGAVGAVAAQTLPVSEEEERAWGGAIGVAVVQRYGGLVEAGVAADYVQLVGQGLALHSSRPGLRWHFGLLRSDAVNAISAPGGYVFVTSGLLDTVADEAELAGVLAHEIAHVTRGHAVEIIKSLKAKNTAMNAATDAWKEAAGFASVLDGFLDDFLTRGLPRETEFEADEDATALLRRVGYDPAGLRRLLERLQASGGGKGSTHPASTARLARLDGQLQRLPQGGAVGADRLAQIRSGSPAVEPLKVDGPKLDGGGIGSKVEQRAR